MTRTKKIIITCTAVVAIVGVIGLAQLFNRLGYKSGWQDAMVAVKAAVQASQYPTVKVVYPSREAIAVIKGGICTPIIPTLKIPEFSHIEWVSPYDRPCGPGKPGQPYQDSAALAAITRAVQQ